MSLLNLLFIYRLPLIYISITLLILHFDTFIAYTWMVKTVHGSYYTINYKTSHNSCNVPLILNSTSYRLYNEQLYLQQSLRILLLLHKLFLLSTICVVRNIFRSFIKIFQLKLYYRPLSTHKMKFLKKKLVESVHLLLYLGSCTSLNTTQVV